jgi:hypothetical protein
LYILEQLPLELQEVAGRLLEGVEKVEEEIVLRKSIVIIIQSRFPIERGQAPCTSHTTGKNFEPQHQPESWFLHLKISIWILLP